MSAIEEIIRIATYYKFGQTDIRHFAVESQRYLLEFDNRNPKPINEVDLKKWEDKRSFYIRARLHMEMQSYYTAKKKEAAIK